MIIPIGILLTSIEYQRKNVFNETNVIIIYVNYSSYFCV